MTRTDARKPARVSHGCGRLRFLIPQDRRSTKVGTDFVGGLDNQPANTHRNDSPATNTRPRTVSPECATTTEYLLPVLSTDAVPTPAGLITEPSQGAIKLTTRGHAVLQPFRAPGRCDLVEIANRILFRMVGDPRILRWRPQSSQSEQSLSSLSDVTRHNARSAQTV